MTYAKKIKGWEIGDGGYNKITEDYQAYIVQGDEDEWELNFSIEPWVCVEGVFVSKTPEEVVNKFADLIDFFRSLSKVKRVEE